jgi:hypothetical protein
MEKLKLLALEATAPGLRPDALHLPSFNAPGIA